ncbi:MAG TPA: hypothetical protein V6D08_09385, partial [Candidatus Obscuribacterales bacterium]
LLRLKKQQGQISDADYDKKIIELTIERYQRLKDSGKDAANDPEYQAATKQVSLMVKKLSESQNPADQERAKKIKEAVAKGIKDVDAAKK